jgi:hypothetical protein
VQAVPEHVLDESLRRLGGEMRVEMLHHHAIHAVAAQRVELVAQQGDTGGSVLGAKNSRGCGSNVITHSGRPRASAAARAREQRLVAAMHTVEIADGERARRPAFGIGQAAEDFHEDGGRAF